jgi:signal transduction histidine kinase
LLAFGLVRGGEDKAPPGNAALTKAAALFKDQHWAEARAAYDEARDKEADWHSPLMRAAVEGAVDLLAEAAQSKGVELVSVVDSEVPISLRGDPGRLRQVLTNLLSNAVKFTSAAKSSSSCD